MAQLFVALCPKPEGRGLDPRWSHGNFSLTYTFWLHYDPVVDSAYNSNEYQEYFLGAQDGWCVGLRWLSLNLFIYLFCRRNTDVFPDLAVLEKKSITHISISVVPLVLKSRIEECARMLYKMAPIVHVVLILH